MPDPAVPPLPQSAESAGSAKVEFTVTDLRVLFALLSVFLPSDPTLDCGLFHGARAGGDAAAALAKLRAITIHRDHGDNLGIEVAPFRVIGGSCGD